MCREEDHDELLHIVSEQSTELEEILGGYSLATLLEEQDPQHQTAVCEVGPDHPSLTETPSTPQPLITSFIHSFIG